MPPAISLDLPPGPLDSRTIPPAVMAISVWSLVAVVAGYVSVVNENHLHVVFALPFILIPGYLLVAGSRRHNLSRESSITVPVRRLFSAGKAESPGKSAPGVDRVLSVALIAVLLVAIGVTISIIVVPKEGEHFTEFYILGPKGKAADYPTEFMAGTPQTVIIGIGNHEYQEVTYTVETLAIESRFDDATNQTAVISATLLDRYSVTIPHSQIVEQPYTFRVRDPDVNRVEFLLFKDEAPPNDLAGSDLIAASYRDLHLWLRVH